MKKKLLIFLCVAVLALASLSSCKITGGNGGNSNGQNTVQTDAIYTANSEIGIVLADSTLDTNTVNKITNTLYGHNALPTVVEAGSESDKDFAHEIVFGECDREISKKAYLYLSRMDNEEHYTGCVMYSDGKSIAIAYDHSAGRDYLLEILIEEYLAYPTLRLEKGVYEQESVSILDYYGEKDAEKLAKSWENLEAQLGPEYGPAIVAAFKEYYTNYNENVVLWFANLYDPDRGGFYFSNSARNTPGYLPDLESTSQALGFIENMGAYARDVLPKEMIRKMGEFAYNMQDPNGFFYHPQWTKEMTDTKLSRRARDLGHAQSLLSLAGMTPKYPFATDQLEDNDSVSGVSLTGRLGKSSVVAASKVVAVEATVPHLASKEAFLTYLRGLGVYNNSYGPGNQISSQFSQIKAAGLAEVCVDYFESIQNPKNGLWEDDVSYGAVNGLLKISGYWAQVGRVFPYAEEAIASTIECIMSEEPTGGVVAMYNCWYSICNINASMKYASGSEGSDFVKQTRETLYKLAPEAIRLTAQKVMQCQKPDGSFSWSDKYSSSTSQGMPVAVPYSEEGDVNATVIGFSGAIGRCFEALGLSRVRPFGQRELYLYLYTLENLGTIVKTDTINIGDPFDFEDAAIDSSPTFDTKLGDGSTALVAEDPAKSGNKVLHLKSAPGNGDTLVIPNTVGMEASCMVFTADMYVSSENSPGYFMQITMDKCYLFTLQSNAAGDLYVIDTNSTTSSNAVYTTYNMKLKHDEWFNIKVEYYAGDAETVRIKAYINNTLVCVSDNYWNQEGTKFTQNIAPGTNATETRLYCMMSSAVDMYLDNIHCYKLNTSYTIENTKGTDTYNVDGHDEDERIFDFNGEFDSDVVYSEEQNVSYKDKIVVYDGTYVLGNGNTSTYSSAGVSSSEFNGSKSILINTSGSAAKLQIPTTRRTSAANCGTLGFDIQVLEAGVGDFAVIKFYDRNDSANSSSVLMGITLSCIEEGDEKFVIMKEMAGGEVSAELDGVKIPVGSIVNMRFEFFHTEDATLIFIDDVSSAASYSIFSGGHKFTLGYASIETIKTVSSKIQIDNVKSERIERSYAMATAPNVDRDVYHFDDMSGIESTGDVKLGKEDGNGVLKIGADGKVTIPVNHRSPVVNVTTFETIMKFGVVNGATKTYIKLTDENMEEVFALALSGDGSGLTVRELTANGETANVIARFAYNAANTVKLEICPSKETANLVVNGIATYVTNVFFDDAKLASKISYVVIESEGAQLSIDETYAEAVNTVFVQCKPATKENGEDTATTYTFESSSSVSLPKKLTRDLKSSGAALRIKSIFRDGALSNALKFTTTNGSCDTLKFTSMSTIAGANCAVFETDIMFSDFTENVTQLNIGGAYMFTLGLNKDGKVTIGALTAGGEAGRVWGKGVALASPGEWVRLRIEVFSGDMNTTLAKVYVNGTLMIVTNNYKGYRNNTDTPVAPSTDTSFVSFYTYTAANGSIFLDNTSFNQMNVPRGNDELNDARPPYVAPAG